MPWITLTIDTPIDLKDAVVGEFSRDDILGVWERPGIDATRVELVLYFSDGRMPPLVLARAGRVFERNGFPAPDVRVGTQENEDWATEWRKGYTSFPVGRRFQVVPSWEAPLVDAGERAILGIDPGLAFGTGTHESTQLMLESIETLLPERGPLLDLGTGSGILAIAAAKLGLTVRAACDVDPDATCVASENIRRNGVRVPVFVGSVDALGPATVTTVLANLTINLIRDLLGDIGRVLTPDGSAVLSGVLDSQSDSLQAAVEAKGFSVESIAHRGEWLAMTVARHGR